MAAAILENRKNEIESPMINVDSSGTGAWHVGEGPNPHSKETWEKHGLHYNHTAKKFSKNDFYASDLILVMDSSNYSNVMALAPTDEAHKVFYLRQFDKDAVTEGDLNVPDPYSLAIDHFETVYEMIDKSVSGLLQELSR
jgi:protein-tyrosine phosphatase